MLLLRTGRKRRWDETNYDWLNDDEVVADKCADFNAAEGKLSVWKIQDDLSNLKRICAALAVRRDNPDAVLDVFWFDERVLESSDVKSVSVPGETDDEEINKSLHIDIIELTTEKLCNLVNAVSRSIVRLKRYSRKEVRELINDAVEKGYLAETDKIRELTRSD